MTDEDRVTLFVEQVLGWIKRGDGWWYDSAGTRVRDGSSKNPLRFDPLESDTDAWRGVDAHPEWEEVSFRFCKKHGFWEVTITAPREDKGSLWDYEASSINRRRALVMACLRAVGVEPT